MHGVPFQMARRSEVMQLVLAGPTAVVNLSKLRLLEGASV